MQHNKHHYVFNYILYFFVILAVIYADSCGNSTSRRLQAKAMPAESVHKKTDNKVGDFIDSLKDSINMESFLIYSSSSCRISLYFCSLNVPNGLCSISNIRKSSVEVK